MKKAIPIIIAALMLLVSQVCAAQADSTYFVLTVEPEGAVVWIDYEEYEPDAHGSVFALLPNGTHRYVVGADGYKTYTGQIYLNGTKEKRTVTLTKEPGKVRIETMPVECNVFLDGRCVCTSPDVITVDAGEHVLVIRSFGYVPDTLYVTIFGGEFYSFRETLEVQTPDANTDEAEAELSEEESIPSQLVEEKPSFMGGDANVFSQWVNERLVYPEIAKDNGIQGRVLLQFTIEANGKLDNVKVLRGVDASLDKEAVRVVSSSPRWAPGMVDGEAVRVTYTFPVIFGLR